ncbi:MAG: hypothetical protein SO169_08560, partial [Parabacteroides sp.]|nr:hypothetical protein [Parabacteroides sp.]
RQNCNSMAVFAVTVYSVFTIQTLTATEMATLGSGEAYLWANKATDKAITQRPIKISIRPRVTKHGGDTIQAIKK